jgi:hypothetical protein
MTTLRTAPKETSRRVPRPPIRRSGAADDGRRRRRWIVAVVVVLALALGAWFVFRPSSPSEPNQPLSACGTVAHALGHPPGGPKRVLLIGDSLLAQPSCALAADLAHIGVETHMHAVPGSGLLTGSVPWEQQTARLLAAVHPDVVVALFSGNYPPPPIVRNGQPVAVDTPAFYAGWQDRARELSAQVKLAGAKLFWVEPPPMVVLGRSAITFAGYTKLGDPVLHSGTVLGDAQGRWTLTKPSCAGDQPVRANDSVHLTDAGSKVFGQQLAHDLAAALGWRPIPAPC